MESVIETKSSNTLLEYVASQLKDPEYFVKKVRELYNRPEAESFDVIEFKDGRVFERFSQPQCIGDRVVGRVWSFRDITERKRAEEALRKQALVWQRMSEGVMVLGNDDLIFDWNPAAEKMFGYSRDEMLGKKTDMLGMADVTPGITSGIRRDGNWSGEIDFVRKDGSLGVAEVNVVPLRDEDGKIIGRVGVNRDITARKREEEALSASEQRFRDFAGAASDWFWEMNAELEFSFISDRYFEIAWLGPEAVIGKKWSDLAGTSRTETAPEKWRAHFYDLDAQRSFRDFEYSIKGKDGDTRYVLISGVPVFGRNGDFRGYRGIGTDETDLKRANIALKEAKEQAEFASRTKTEFLANMSHELRTPLNSIIGFSEMLEGEFFGPLGSDKNREYAGDIKSSGTHLLRIISDILDVSKIEAGAVELDEKEIYIGETIDACVAMVKGRSIEAGVELSTNVPDDLPYLLADLTALKQILLNLLSNAIKFTPSGGKATVKALVDADGASVLKVVDTGIGIAAAEIPKVLEPFSQVGDIITRTHEGAGLGLSLAKSLTELHGGTLELESEVGVGTTATVRFPPDRTIRP